MYWESPEKAQSHIQPLEVSPGLLLLMLSSVIREKLDVLQILHVWSAEQVASRLEGGDVTPVNTLKTSYYGPQVGDCEGFTRGPTVMAVPSVLSCCAKGCEPPA